MADRSSPHSPDTDAALRDLAGIVLGDNSFEAVLEAATRVAKAAIPGADEVSVTMRDGGQHATVAASGPLAKDVDESQYAVDEGPCLDAIRTSSVVLVSDLSTETRWPGYRPRAIAAGVASSLSIPLMVDGSAVGALNSFSRTAHAFDDEQVRRLGEDLGAYAGIVLNNAGLYFTAASKAEQMSAAMKSRAVIEQAKGILIASRRCGADEAFDILVRLSQQSHRKLRDVAEALVQETSGG